MSIGFNNYIQQEMQRKLMEQEQERKRNEMLQGVSPLRPEFQNPIEQPLRDFIQPQAPQQMVMPEQSAPQASIKEVSPMVAKPPQEPQSTQQQKPMGLFDRLGRGFNEMVSDPNFRDRLIIGLQGMTTNPNQALIQMAQSNIKRRQDKSDLAKNTNMTIDYLESMGFTKEADMIRKNPRMASIVLADVQSRRKASQEAQATFGKEQAKEMAKARVNLPSAMGTAETAIAAFDDVLKLSEGDLDRVLGAYDSRVPTMTEKSARIESVLDRASGQSAMAAFESLKGAGAITEAELMQARQAFSRLDNRIMSPQDYKDAVREAKMVADNLYQIAQQRAGLSPESVITKDPITGGNGEIKVLGVKR